ncbi:spore gernimation protein GerB [Alkalihalobacillus pseudalcaliphilus]|nr:spore gernimation protein GerB [Alkalihalobacillus pseudalcaliphilus]
MNNKALLIEPYLVFFLVHSLQAGVGVLGFTRYIAEAAGFQSWIAIIISGLYFHLLIWMIYKIIGNQKKDIIAINKETFGKFIGSFISLMIVFYFVLAGVVVLRTYVEIIQIWIFPDISVPILCLTLSVLAYYIIIQGFRVIVGVSFFSLIIPFFLLFSNFSAFEYAEFQRVLPLFNTNVEEQLLAAKTMTLSFLGPEILLLAYPFIDQAPKSQKFAHLASFYTMALYLIIAFVHFSFYTLGHLQTIIWPTINIWKIVELPFLERFEYIGIATWLIIIIPNITLALWASSRALKEICNVKHIYTLRITGVIILLIALLFHSREAIDQLNNFMSLIGQVFVTIFIPVIFIIVLLKRKMSS